MVLDTSFPILLQPKIRLNKHHINKLHRLSFLDLTQCQIHVSHIFLLLICFYGGKEETKARLKEPHLSQFINRKENLCNITESDTSELKFVVPRKANKQWNREITNV